MSKWGLDTKTNSELNLFSTQLVFGETRHQISAFLSPWSNIQQNIVSLPYGNEENEKLPRFIYIQHVATNVIALNQIYKTALDWHDSVLLICIMAILACLRMLFILEQ